MSGVRNRPEGFGALPRLLDETAKTAGEWLAALPEREVKAAASAEELREALGGPLNEEGELAPDVLRNFTRAAERGLVASPGPRYFGFVTGGALPASLAADWLASVWDQNAVLFVSSPAASVAEEVVASWLLELLGLPADASVGLVTGCQMANFTCLAAARHEVLRKAGWDVEADGLCGAPRITVAAGGEAHATLLVALRMLGLGERNVLPIPVDEQGRMRPSALKEALENVSGPLVVCLQAGNVNSGAFDPCAELVPLAKAKGVFCKREILKVAKIFPQQGGGEFRHPSLRIRESLTRLLGPSNNSR